MKVSVPFSVAAPAKVVPGAITRFPQAYSPKVDPLPRQAFSNSVSDPGRKHAQSRYAVTSAHPKKF